MAAHRVTETSLFRLLVSREITDGFDAAQISSRVNLVVEEAWPILQQVSRHFPLYTLHDPEHSYRVAQNLHRLIPQPTLEHLNSIELSVLILAAYLHDIGMASSEAEFHGWLQSPAYDEFVSAHERWAAAVRRVQQRANEDVPDDSEAQLPDAEGQPRGADAFEMRCLQDIIYTDYLREIHAARGAEYVIQRHGVRGASLHRIQVGEVNYAREVALVCQSHWENPSALKAPQYRRDMYIGKFPVNLQYCAILLRLADVLELDPERTPATLLDFLLLDLTKTQALDNPMEVASAKSAEEWAKHRAVLGYKISPDEIRIEARCSHPAIQKGLREWCDYIDAERRECRIIARDNTEEITRKYGLDLALEVRKEYIQSDGSYIYTDFQLQLDYDRIVSLLMGTQLWGDPVVVVRELLQNALDACSHRAALSRRRGIPYTPKITFGLSYQDDHEGMAAVLTCEDNGAGMSQDIVERYLIRIGSSYYQSGEFRRQGVDFKPISHFGLGLMSCFMLSDKITVDTAHVNESLVKDRALRVELDSAGRYVVLRPLAGEREGTFVSVPVPMRKMHFIGDDLMFHRRFRGRKFHPGMRFHPEMDFHPGVFYALYEVAVHLDVPIDIVYNGDHREIIEPRPFAVPPIDDEPLKAMKNRFREFVFRYTHEEGRGIAGVFRFLLPVSEKGAVRLGCAVESTFKLIIDEDGDLCLTTPSYKTEGLNVGFDLPGDWDTDEVRGVYRYKYGQKPPASEKYDNNVPTSILELVRGSFHWSQDGLLVGWPSGHPAFREDKSDESKAKDDEKENEAGARKKLFKLVPVPGLNAADIDMRDHARVSLNVQRSDFQRDASFESFRQKYYALAAEMWQRILAEADALPPTGQNRELLRVLMSQAPEPLRMQLTSLIPQIANEEFFRRHRGPIKDGPVEEHEADA
ncbi:MAG TPA: ATP-binding protein [Bryobacteraceae bacterium]|nr:ATP-binding protein [Bryobacteraceae bacterium]